MIQRRPVRLPVLGTWTELYKEIITLDAHERNNAETSNSSCMIFNYMSSGVELDLWERYFDYLLISRYNVD